MTPVVHHLPPGRVCQLVWSLGQLGFKPNGQLIRTALRCSGRCMSLLEGRDLCQLLQGLVELQLQPHLLWLDACCAHVLQVRPQFATAAVLTCQDACNCLWEQVSYKCQALTCRRLADVCR